MKNCMKGFPVSKDGASTTSLDNLFQCFSTLIIENEQTNQKNPQLDMPSKSPVSYLKPVPLVLSQQTPLRSLFPSFLQPPFSY